jgi:hypothetical protein
MKKSDLSLFETQQTDATLQVRAAAAKKQRKAEQLKCKIRDNIILLLF